MGMIYQRGEVYWIKYYRNGRCFRESTRSIKEDDAVKLLKLREGEIAQGKMPGVYFDRVRFDDLAEDYLRDYRLNNRKSLERAEISIAHLKRFFERAKVTTITSPRIAMYMEKRIDDGAKNSTINRELAALKRMLNLGARQTPPKVDRVPHISMLEENNVRKGFFEYEDFDKMRSHLPDYLKGLVTFGYKTGWRLSEITGLKWSSVDLKQGTVRLEPGETKNKEGRTIYMDAELRETMETQQLNMKKIKTLVPWVFPGKDGISRIHDFRCAWETACKDAKIGKHLFHDLRRTAVRNMIRAGIPERVAMMISGHKTRTVFDRYNIVNDADLKQAAEKIYFHGHNTGTIGKSDENGRGTGRAQVVDFISGARGEVRTLKGFPTGS